MMLISRKLAIGQAIEAVLLGWEASSPRRMAQFDNTVALRYYGLTLRTDEHDADEDCSDTRPLPARQPLAQKHPRHQHCDRAKER